MQLENLNVEQQEVLITPEQLKARLPVSEDVREAVNGYREIVRNIVDRKDPRLLVVVGPCSIHDVDAAKEYAQRLKGLADDVADQVFVVMRAYFEKPRSTVGWKGLINDPHLDDSFKVAEGLHIGRQLLLELSQMGLPDFVSDALPPSASSSRPPTTPTSPSRPASVPSLGALASIVCSSPLRGWCCRRMSAISRPPGSSSDMISRDLRNAPLTALGQE